MASDHADSTSSVFEHSVTLRQLRFLRAVVEGGGFSAAARLLLTSQPAVSYEIARLEQLAGAPLVERLGRSIRLTTEGSMLYDYAVHALGTIDQAADTLREMRGIRRGSLSLGADVVFGSYMLPGLLAAFKQEFPKLDLRLSIMNSSRLLGAIHDGSIDLAILCSIRGYLHEDPRVVDHRFDDCRFLVVAPPGHPLANRRGISQAELAEYPFAVGEPSSWPRRLFDDMAMKLSPRPPIAIEATTSVLKHAVLAGLGLTILSDTGIAAELERGEIVILDVEGYPVPASYCAVHLKDRRLSFAARAFLQFLIDSGTARAILSHSKMQTALSIAGARSEARGNGG